MTPSLLTVVLLGIVEGLTEFLPVSSTGHLILAGALLGWHGEASKTFDIVIQLGAILAVIVVYWRRFFNVIIGLFSWRQGAVAFTRNVLLGFLPSVVVGAFAYKAIKRLMESPLVVAVALVVGGIAILLIERMVKRHDVHTVEDISARRALGVGLAQCLAMIPGVSRSGATIMGALSLGIDRRTAAEYSFFLAVPTMIAASVYDIYKSHGALDLGNMQAIGLGFVISFVVALMVVRGFVAIVSRYGFAPFAWYRIIAGGIALVLLLM